MKYIIYQFSLCLYLLAFHPTAYTAKVSGSTLRLLTDISRGQDATVPSGAGSRWTYNIGEECQCPQLGNGMYMLYL